MKKISFALFLVLQVMWASGQSWNPYVSQGIINPAPLLPLQLNGAGVISFNTGNTGSSLMPYSPSDPANNVKLTIALSRGLPNVTPLNQTTALNTIGGSWASMFTWTYDMGLNSFTGIQNQDIQGQSQGNVTIQYKVSQNSPQASPLNGFNTLLTPPAYTSGTNSTSDDEVSSYTWTEARDYGDAPVSYGSVSHMIDFENHYVYLGAAIDHDSAYLASSTANGDDITGIDDEDGVTFPMLVQGNQAVISVTVTGDFGYLNGWIDWNGDGDFADAGEKVATNKLIQTTNYDLTITVPANAVITAPTFARFRFGTPAVGSSGNTTWGEVEDYMINIYPYGVSGHVFDDANGMNNNYVDGTGTNASGNIYMNLVKSSNNQVVSSKLVGSSGTYSFGLADGIQPNTSYIMIVTATAQVPGNTLTSATFPANWVPTGENLGTGTGNDGTVDGKLAVNTNSGTVINANFGLDQLPNSNNVTGSFVNPGGTNTVIVPTLAGSDPEDGTLGEGSTLAVTSLANNGTLFYNGAAVTLNQLIVNYSASLMVLDPVNGATAASFTYAFRDAAGKQDPTPATVTLNFSDLTVGGNVFDDANGMTDNLVNGTGTNASGNIYMNLVNATGNLVSSSIPVASDGSFSFGTSGGVMINTGFNLIITAAAQNQGTVLTSATFPPNWVPTGEILGTGQGNDGTTDGILAVSMGSTNLANANFGLDQLPSSDNVTGSYVNPGGYGQVLVTTLTGSDPEDGQLGAGSTLVITSAASGGTIFYSGIPVTVNQVITGYNPVLLTADPFDGPAVMVFNFAFMDAAGMQDPTPASATLVFSDLTISGTVLDDGNGMNNNYVDGYGTNASGMIYMNLVTAQGSQVAASVAAGGDGAFSFGTADGVLNVTDYLLVITVTQQVPGATLISASFPPNWVPTGEILGTGPGNDGNTDGMLAVSTNAGTVSNAFLGLDQLPQTEDITGTHLNPGGTNVFQVPTLSGSDPEDGPLGAGGTFIIASIATNGILYYNNVPVTPDQVIGDYDPSLLVLDPADGTPVVSFTYIAVDAAGFQDPLSGTVTITMTLIPYADLSVSKTDHSDRFTVGKDNVYTMVVENAWNDDAPGTAVTDTAPSGTVMNWVADFSTGASGNPSGNGDIRETVNIPAGGTVTYTVTVSVPCNHTGDLINTAYVEGPAGITDPDTTNNTATDTDIQNTWTGAVSSDWSDPSNWTLGVPDTADATGASIPGGLSSYPVISDTAMTAATLVIGEGATLAIGPGCDLYVLGCTAINGPDALWLRSDEQDGNASFITSQNGSITYPNDGSARVDLFLEKCPYSRDCSFYVSPPVSDALSGVFAGDSLRSYSEPSGSFSPFITGNTEPLIAMEGYMLGNSADETRTFHGKLNDGAMTRSLTLTPGKGNGWNLAANPYPSWIDLSKPPDWTNVDMVAYPYDHISGNYKPYPILAGFGLSGRHIPSMTGFFVHVNPGKSQGTIRFGDNDRTGRKDPGSGPALPGNLLRLNVQGNSAMYDEVLIWFTSGASTGYDQDIDCFKLEGAATAPQLSSVSSDDHSLAINVLPFDSLDQNIIVPLEFYVPSQKSGDYILTASRIESFTEGTNIWLEDRKADTMVYLNNNPSYDFNYAGTDDPARFFLHFHYPHYGIREKGKGQDLRIYSFKDAVFIKDLSGHPQSGDVYLYNMMGQETARAKLEAIPLNKYRFSLPAGYYVVRVITAGSIAAGKVFIE